MSRTTSFFIGALSSAIFGLYFRDFAAPANQFTAMLCGAGFGVLVATVGLFIASIFKENALRGLRHAIEGSGTTILLMIIVHAVLV